MSASSSSAEAPAERPRRVGRLALLGLVALGVLALGAFAGWSYLRTQYYVGVEGEQVAVFRGVNTSVAGISLSDLEERTELDVDRLDRDARPQVEKGWVADGRDDAFSYVERLQERAAPDCPEPAPAPAPTPPPPPGTFPAPPAEPVDDPCAQDSAS